MGAGSAFYSLFAIGPILLMVIWVAGGEFVGPETVKALSQFAFRSAYGITGSFLVLLLWVYYSSQIFCRAPNSLTNMRSPTVPATRAGPGAACCSAHFLTSRGSWPGAGVYAMLARIWERRV